MNQTLQREQRTLCVLVNILLEGIVVRDCEYMGIAYWVLFLWLGMGRALFGTIGFTGGVEGIRSLEQIFFRLVERIFSIFIFLIFENIEKIHNVICREYSTRQFWTEEHILTCLIELDCGSLLSTRIKIKKLHATKE